MVLQASCGSEIGFQLSSALYKLGLKGMRGWASLGGGIMYADDTQEFGSYTKL